VTEIQKSIEEMDTKPPEKKKLTGNIMLVLVLGCWLLFLYFSGGPKGPG
jgi:hypothetical protein